MYSYFLAPFLILSMLAGGWSATRMTPVVVVPCLIRLGQGWKVDTSHSRLWQLWEVVGAPVAGKLPLPNVSGAH